MPALADPDGTYPRRGRVAGDPDRRVGFLPGLRQAPDGWQPRDRPLVGRYVLRPQSPADGEIFVRPPPAPVERHPQGVELLAQPPDPDR